MEKLSDSEKYPKSMRLTHWVSAIIMVILLVIGIYMADLDPDASNKYDLYPIHESFGLFFIILITVRMFFRKKGPVPAPVSGLKQWETIISKWVHRLLYVCMIVMPLSGYLAVSTFPYMDGIDVFGVFIFSDLTPKSEYWTEIFAQVHGITSWLLLFLITGHVLAVVKHKVFDTKENDVLSRMT